MDQENKLFQSLQKAVLRIKTQELEIRNLKNRVNEPIAIIGMSCRFPGGANNPQAFWDLLKNGRDGITEIPPDRWDIDSFYDSNLDAPGKMYIRRGGFLDSGIDTFDANFFGISAREAEYMDPQQRLLLEVAWEALENACINPLSLKDSKTGVFLGICTHDYNDLLSQVEKAETINVYQTTGNTSSILAGRLSYFLGLQGPSLAVDTACSSSLVSIHYACKSLQSGECHLAIAGGVNLILNPTVMISFCSGHMLAKDGNCKTFDAAADGYIRSEGCGVIVLKRLSEALRDQDPILGIIRATEVNQDGASSGLTVPNREAQAALIRKALELAVLDSNAIDYIETHGTGTPLGDPIEVGALSNVFSGRQGLPLWLGAVKTNIGHLEGAAGVAGVIKTLLALTHEAIPQNLHFQNLNPHISLDSISAKIPLTLTPWLRSSRPRIAGISSFGFSGTNAHAIIEEPPVIELKKNLVDRPWHLVTLSAKTSEALDQLVDLYTKQLPDGDLPNIAFTANTGRAHFPHRVTVVAQTRDDLLKHLQTGDYLIGRSPSERPNVVFVFTGQTVEYAELMETSPVFKAAMELSHGLYEYSLYELWKSWGIVPDYVAGEGIGEIIAAIIAGIITLEEGLKLITKKDAAGISYRKPQIGFISSWTGQVIRKEGLTADYWKPHESIKNIPEGTLIISFQNSWKDLLQTLSQLYLNGIQIDWKAYDKLYNRKKVSLPTYPFQRERYWVEALKTQKKHILPLEAHPLLGEFIPSPSGEKLFRNKIDLDFLSYFKDHKVFDSVLFPGAGFAELMHAAGTKLFQGQPFTINNLVIEQPMALDNKKAVPIELLATPNEEGYTASVYSINEQAWILHAKCDLSRSKPNPTLKLEWEHLRSVCQKSIDIDALYHQFDALGLHYGKQFRTLRKLWTDHNEFIVELEGEASSSLIDGGLQAITALREEDGNAYLPYRIEQIRCYSDIGTSIRIHGKLTQITEDSTTAEIEIFSYDGKPLMKIEGFHARKTDQAHLQQMLTKQTGVEAAAWFYQISWLPKPLEKTQEPLTSPWVIVSQEEEEGIEGIQSQIVKPQQAVTEIVQNSPAGILWFASGKDSLRHALEFVQALSKLESKPSLYFITHGIQPVRPVTNLKSTPFNGFFKTLRLEMPSLDCRHIDLGLNEKLPAEELLAEDQEEQVAYSEGVRYVPRLQLSSKVKRSANKLMIPMAQSFQLETSTKGPLENLYLRPINKIPAIGPHEIAVEVKAAGLNFRDVLNAMGLYPGDPGPLGGECAGIVTAVGSDVTVFKQGDQVLGLAPGCFASHAVGSAELFTLMPSNLKFSEAAAIPIVFSTAYQALINLAKIKAGEKVLIHAAAGGVGLAAIQIAQQAQAEIYVTAGNQEKHAYLRSLGIHHIYNSRTLDYADEILRDTQGQGVDIVLNSLSGEGFIATTVSACNQEARFVEIGRRNIWSKDSMHDIRPDIDYFILALDDLMIQQPREGHNLLQTVTAQFAKGKFKPLPCVCYPITEAESAFEYLQRAKNIGKVVLTLPEGKKLKIDSTGSYLITGGLGGLGLKVAEWLAKQSAKHLVLAGRRASQNIEIPNTTVETVAIDVSQKPDVDALMQKFGAEWPELKGIIHAAGIIDDGVLGSQDWSRFEKVFAPKVQGSWNLHEASLTKPLDFFVLFSSIASTIGSPGQINYASANAYMDALATFRHDQGLPALTISWGPWAEVGLAASLTERHRASGFQAFKPDEGIKAFELALTGTSSSHVSIANVDWKLFPFKEALLSDLVEAKTTEVPILLQRLIGALPSERKGLSINYLQQIVGKILGLSSINPDAGFFEAGMDSLMTEELQEKLQADIGNLHRLPSTLAFDYPSVHKLTQYFEEHIFPLIGIKEVVQKTTQTKTTFETDRIAIIGLSCRFPGGANNPQAFWELLKQGYDGITEVPDDRWDIESFYDSDPEAPGKMYVRRSGFLDANIDTFDANFFGISPREAEYMDPQQRLLLEVVWEALEQACINPLSLNCSSTGVFIGVCSHDYTDLLAELGKRDEINVYLTTGNANSILAGRISYFLGLQGPCLALDTACSSSLVAIHSACKSLQSGECQLALAGGVNLMLNPSIAISMCKGRMLAKDGYCKTFDAEADGFVRGEGCGVVVLKCLSDAIRDQDPILGVVRATDINQDGATSGLTVPNGESQTTLIRRALEHAKIEPNAIDYIEAHGAGTSLGDPIEVGALSNVFHGRQDHPLLLGTVKTNIGHLEAAAGMAGVIKIVLALNHEAIPPHLHFKHLNPRISLDSIPAQIPLTLTPWQRSSRPRIAGISAFGFSGTNAHAIIEEPPVVELKENLIDRPWHLVTLSAKTQPALDQLVDLYAKQLPEENIADIAFTANTGRAHFPHRVTLVAQTKDELLQHLQTRDYLIGFASAQPPKVTFIFTGQSVENTELMETSPVFKEAMERSRGLYEYALLEFWKSWGIIPDYVLGEGIGDIIAAIAAGILSLEEGLKLISTINEPGKLESVAREIHYHEPQIGFISSWTGQIIRKENLSADYWKPHESIRNIPERTLVISTQTTWKDLLQTLAQLYLNGIQIDWKAFDKPYNRKKVSLPTYPFQRERYWVEALNTQGHKTTSRFYQIEWRPKPLEMNTEFRIQNSELWLSVSHKEDTFEWLHSKTVKPEESIEEVIRNRYTDVLWEVSGKDSLKVILSFVQALGKLETKPRLYFITNGIQPIGPITDLANAPFNGFYKTLKLEIRDLDCRHIDLAPNEKLQLQEFLATDKEDQVAYRHGIRYVARFVHKNPVVTKKFKIDPTGSYLITGGLGALGRKTAEWLVKQGAKHLVLASRRTSQNIEISNATIETLAVDISQRPAVNALMQKFGCEWPELKGIIHAAGIVGEGNYLMSQDWGQFEKVFAPKVQGSWNLHEASLDKALDFFVLFSSLSSVLGLPRESGYAAANSYMDALAYFRQEKGLPALAINWGAWAEIGRAAKLVRRVAGQAGFKPDEGVKALELALSQTTPQISVVDMEWKSYPHHQTFLSELIPAKRAEAPVLLQRFTDALPSERKDILTDYLQQTVGNILGTSALNLELGFFEAGMDSLMTEELYEKLQTDIGNLHKFPSTVAFDFPSIQKLSQYFEEHIFPLIGIETLVQKAAPTKGLVEADRIAIIGLGCRFPGGANHPQAFWQLLKRGYDSITEIPQDRWDVDSFYDPDPEALGKMYVRRSSFLNTNIETFDANFFGISPREAEYMDPQQRLILEVAWEALENSCIDPLSLNGSPTGVFIGVTNLDYYTLISSLGTHEDMNAYIGSGNTSSALAGRLSYFFGLQGPCFAVDTACSSSLVALNSACKSLQTGECHLALAGGVNLMLNPDDTISACKSHMLSKDGYCKTFDAEADGFVRGEGCGMVVLKRLSEAIRDHDSIFGVIRATAVNQDGATSGFTVPNGEAQATLIRQALANAELEPNAIDYIEAHGTGTSLGDPIEVGALINVFRGRQDHPLLLGTVKTNIGHLESAAGIAGVIKIVLALTHEAIPQNLHFKNLNPRISLDSIPANIPLTLTPWQRSSRPRIAGVSSFGFSGTNAHAIIEEPPLIEYQKNAVERPWHLLTISAKTPLALDQLIELYIKQLPEEDLADIAFTANTGRAHFQHRVTVVAQTKAELLQLLQSEDYLIGQASAKPPKITFIFTGQTVANTELMETSPVFKEAMERSKGLYEYALFELWKSWGIAPDYVVGDGIGDITAAIVAGMMTLEDGLRLITAYNNPTELESIAREIHYHEPKIGFTSSWTGQVVRKEGITADYWKLHEIIRNIPEGTPVISTHDNWKYLLQTLSQLYFNGIAIDWKAFDKPYNRKKVSLPTYPFQRERYWVEALKARGLKLSSLFYQIDWQPKPLEQTEEQLKNPWLIISQEEEEVEGLQYKIIKPEKAVEDVVDNMPTGVLWFATREDSLKHALSFVQALDKLDTKPSLYFITRGIQPIGPITDLANATFNGFYRTLKLEMPELDSRHIDLGPNETLPLQELLAADKEDQIAYHQGIRYVARLIHKKDVQQLSPEKLFKIDLNGSYLITGELDGLGRKVAEWLVKKGAKYLVLAGRKISQNIEIPNATIEPVVLDISARPAVDALMQNFGTKWPELKGIIHAAGIFGEGNYLSALDWSEFEKVFAPKIHGSWNLHEASIDKPLDFFVLYSSLSSVLGLPKQSEYASANAYMDALAHFRNERGLPGLAISWGNWAEVGMATKFEGRYAGQASLKPDEGMKAMELALLQSNPHLSVVDMDWKSYPHQQIFLSELTPAKRVEAPILLQHLVDALPSERKDILTSYLQQSVGKILGLLSINPEIGFFEAGMDSLMAVELRNRLQNDLGGITTIPSTLAFDYPSMQKLSQYFEEHIFPLIGIKAIVQKAAPTRAVVESEAIAIIGMGCRFPGGANDPRAFWELLKQGYDGISEIPPDRWDVDAYYDPDPEAPGKMYMRLGGFLNIDLEAFDANFFGISPREAEYMDPQQRWLLEVAWEALEQACINPTSLKGSLTGVFIGSSSHDYFDLIGSLESLESINAYIGTGNASSVLAGRLSYFLGLQGPCFAVDTACSSSLVALNSACKCLQNNECKLALAGGVNLILSPSGTIYTCKAHMLAKDGYCKTFDAEANGYVRSEGCGIVVLKRLSDAIQDQDPIFGVIRATTVNQDGASSGLTIPNGEAQTALLHQALEHAKLEPIDIDYIEAHGTGTSLGDPIEVGALSTIFSGRKDLPLWIGAVKTNIGHLEAAAGIAGLIKTVLALDYEAIPPHLHFKHLNPHISLDSIPAQIPLTLTPWQRSSRPRIAGVSSFGFSGTNAHAIIEEPPLIEYQKNAVDRPWHLLTISAKTQLALDQLVELYIKQLPEEDLADIAFTANTGRAHFQHRVTVVAQTKAELLQLLQSDDYWIGQASAKPPKITFIFTGQTIANTELMETSPVFKEAMERSKGLYEYALFELWKSWGIAPDYVVGDGIGDITAAIVAGMMTLEDGLRLITAYNNPTELESIAREIHYHEPKIGFISSWTGQVVRKEGITADYWKPHEILRNIPEGTLVISTHDNWKYLLQTLSQLYLNGIPIDWKSFDKPYNRKKVSLPTYPFQRERYWVEALKARGHKLSSLFYQIDWQPKPFEMNTERIQNSELWLAVSHKEETFEWLQSKTVKPEESIEEVIRNGYTDVLWDVSGKDPLKEILSFVKALGKLETKPRFYFITRGIQPIGPITDLSNATFNGFYKTLKLEMPDLDCRHIDLGPNETLPPQELLATDKEDQVAYRQGIRYVTRLIQKSPDKFKQLTIDPTGSYLITGGLRGLGLKVAEWLAKKGAKHLVLAGRRISPKIEIPHTTIETVAIDISQKSAVDALMQKFGSEWPELKGIIHAAGIIDDGTLSSQDWSKFENVFAPKVLGSWNLHKASLSKPLDFFVLFSSVASSIGSPGQINYSSANAYMDALTYFRKEKELPALTISWGPWAEIGMAAHLSERHRAGGFIAFKPDVGIKALELALTQIHPHVSIANVNWKLVPYKQTYLSELIAATPAEAPILFQHLTDALPSERKDILTSYLQQSVCKILGLTSIDPEIGFFAIGMDSLMAVELRNRLQNDLGGITTIPSTLAFDYPSVQKLSQYFEEHIFPLIGIKAIVQKAAPTRGTVESEAIAIIGMGCRFPGGANDPRAFWELLKQGYDGISEIPPDRWDVDAYYDPDPEAPGKMYMRLGGFLNIDLEAFDANFFGISPREAEYMDPQQRWLLEVVWEALEQACINPTSLKGSSTGVFIGASSHDYSDLIGSLESLESINAYIGTGNASSVLAGRLSYFLGLQGPCFAVDTACSSSLVALNSACKCLQNNECKLALAGGVNLILSPSGTIYTCKAHMLAKDGYCKTFDAEANGYVRSEGCGIVVLKRLSDAIQDQDPIFGVIRATTVNQDGASSGLTIPNGEAQTALLHQALEHAKLEPIDIDYIEAHGTGTSLGDPIEVGALSTIFSGRKDLPLWIGAVKTNIGHLEAAAGIAGLIKTVLALDYEAIPPHLHFKHLNPHISLDSIPAQIPLTLTPWQRSSRPRIAGVSSFGFSGTNAHAIIEEPPLIEYQKNAVDRPWHLLTISAKTQLALDQLVELYIKQLPEEDLADIAFTANTGRAHFQHRVTVVAQTKAELLQLLQSDDYWIGQASAKPPKITFIFTGQTVANTELMETSPVFKEAMERSKGLYEYALFELWKSWGIAPDYVVGDGIGDITAAIVAGMMTLEDGLRLITVYNNPAELESIAREIHYHEPKIGFISSWTGQVVRKEGITVDYWKPHEILRNIPEGTLVISTHDNWKYLLQTLSQLYLNGIPIDWKSFDKPYNRKKVSLPTYPFQRERYWVEALKARGHKLSSLFYQIDWQPKPFEMNTERIQNSELWLAVSHKEETFEWLQSKTVKPEESIEEVIRNRYTDVLWDVSGKDPLKEILSFVKALGKLETKPSLYFITRGIQPVGPITDLANATFNGFYKTLKLEMPDLDCRHIDLGPNETLPPQELLAADEEDQVAYRQGIRYVTRLIHEDLQRVLPRKTP